MTTSGTKVTVVGVGAVGMACAFSILTQNISHDIALIDIEKNKLRAEELDLQHGSCFVKNANISASDDFAVSAGSKICVVTSGARQRIGETRLDLLKRNVDIMKEIIPQLVKHSPNAVIMLVSNPVDIMTYVAWKLSGLPKNKIIGSGTHLDSSRFKFYLSQRMGVAGTSCHGYVIGEHGDSSGENNIILSPLWALINEKCKISRRM